MKKIGLLSCLLFLLPLKTILGQDEDNVAKSNFLNFQFNGVQIFQNEGRNISSLGLAWYPSLALNDNWSLHFLLGTTWLRNTSRDIFYSAEYECLGAVKLNQLELALGGGAQTWFGNGGTALEGTGGLSYPLDLGIFSDLFLSYSLLFFPNNTTHFLKFGLVLNFGETSVPNTDSNIETLQPTILPE